VRHNLSASLRHVEMRQVRPDYTLRWEGKLCQIQRAAVTPGLRAQLQVEACLDGTLAVRHQERYLAIEECGVAEKTKAATAVKPAPKRSGLGRGSEWNKNFDLLKAPKVWQSAQQSSYRKREGL
jgi:hypothetical protein